MSLRHLARRLAILGALVLAACSTPETRVILLPQADGQPSAVVVSAKGSPSGPRTLSEPYERATARAQASAAPTVDKVSPDEVQAENKALFELLPPSAQRFTIHFEMSQTALTPESQRTVEEALKAAQARKGGDIVVTGYTDTVGTVARNDALSRERAMIVRQIFIDHGFAPNRIEAVGRGERELAVPTADEVVEPGNRRVTIEVR